jgi:perosamine synthetase
VLDGGGSVHAIAPTGLGGAVSDLPAISALARELGAAVIEDAAHCLGASYRVEGVEYNAASCTHSDFAILSFHPVKHITTLEGGAILTRDSGAYRELLELRSHGITRDPARLTVNDGPWYYEQQRLGYHYRLSDVACALGLSQLRRLEAFLARRRAIAARYESGLIARGLLGELQPLQVPDHVRSAYHLYIVQLRSRPGELVADVARRRRRLYDDLGAVGIRTQVHYIPLHRQPDFGEFVSATAGFPGADEYYARCISLPMFPAMTDVDIDRVLDALGGLLS